MCVPKGLGDSAERQNTTYVMLAMYIYILRDTGAWRGAEVRLETEARTNTFVGTAVQ